MLANKQLQVVIWLSTFNRQFRDNLEMSAFHFGLNFFKNVFLILWIDFFPVQILYLYCLYNNLSVDVPSSFILVWIYKIRNCYYYTLILSDQFPFSCFHCFYHNISATVPYDPFWYKFLRLGNVTLILSVEFVPLYCLYDNLSAAVLNDEQTCFMIKPSLGMHAYQIWLLYINLCDFLLGTDEQTFN